MRRYQYHLILAILLILFFTCIFAFIYYIPARASLLYGAPANHLSISVGQLHPGQRCAIVVLAGGHVAGAACEVNLKDSFVALDTVAGQPWEFARCPSVAVIALRVRSVIVQSHQRAVTIQ